MIWTKKRVTIVTKAYPEPSRKYGTVVCMAGITEEGEWIRLYPVDMRHFIGEGKISKFDTIEVDVKPHKDKLSRKESHKMRPDSIKIVDRSLTYPRVDWDLRRSKVLPRLNRSLSELKELYDSENVSLGLLKPSDDFDFIKTDELRIYEKTSWSYTLNLDGEKIPLIEKIPHIFKYRFRCQNCSANKPHLMQCEDWELFEAYRSWAMRYRNTDILWEKIKEKFHTKMAEERDLYFVMGMYSQYPTWFIIGIFYPPRSGNGDGTLQQRLF